MSHSSDKLAQTRLAILEHIERKKEDRRDSREQLQAKARMAVSPGSRRFAGMGAVSRNWWEHHPAHTLVELATPLLSSYGRRKPLQFLGIAAAAGALFIFARPWKLISLTGLAVALLKSPMVTSAISGVLTAANLPPGPSSDEPDLDDE